MFLLTSWFVRVSIDTKLDLLSQRSVTHKCDHTAMRGTNHVYTVNIVNLVSSLKVTVQVGRSPPDDRTYCHLIMTKKTIPFTTKMLQFTDEKTNREKVPNTFSKLLFFSLPVCLPPDPQWYENQTPSPPFEGALWNCMSQGFPGEAVFLEQSSFPLTWKFVETRLKALLGSKPCTIEYLSFEKCNFTSIIKSR